MQNVVQSVVPNVVLNNGVKMPILGFGIYQIENHKVCEQSVYDALMAGYRLIDTAAAYKNEKAVGRASCQPSGNPSILPTNRKRRTVSFIN